MPDSKRTDDGGAYGFLQKVLPAAAPALVIASVLLFIAILFPVLEYASRAAPPAQPTVVYVDAAIGPGLPQAAAHIVLPSDSLFEFNSAKLTEDSAKLLQPAISEMRKAGDADSILVIGHSDSIGGQSSYNDKLSLERAQAIQSYVESAGFAHDKIEAIGVGDRAPAKASVQCDGLSLDKKIACEAPNRRVEIWLRLAHAPDHA
ncbi:OmpA family protein [Dyella japonica]|uniref:OmpA-like domain-containing protein n=1 Tax=Dyella japonica A8 TaxID=1217721 RepID=A0A075K1B8_9GAMM|nr:OmpA family protein [Dyella japonica]AIF48136.1 hypothetical protein HY57_13135 [Dyella japonica A8]